MEKERASNNGAGRDNNNSVRDHHHGELLGGGGSLVVRSSASATTTTSDTARQATTTATTTTTTDFVLQWGNRKRLRCMKVQAAKDDPAHNKATARVDRRVVRSDHHDHNLNPNPNTHPITNPNNHPHRNGGGGGGYLNLRHRPSSPPFPNHHRVLRNSENSSAMRGQSNGGLRNFSSPDKKGAASNGHPHRNGGNHQYNDGGNNNKGGAWSEQDGKKVGGGSSSGGSGDGGAMPQVWPPKFVIALTNKEKEEDFIIFKGSKLPQRPKKRAKMVQRTVNLVSPGAWLCDLTLERYEVREKKISKKRPRGLKAMGNMDSDSE